MVCEGVAMSEQVSSYPLIEFYRGKGTDSEGRYLNEVLKWNHYKLEVVHNYIQWLFPLRVASAFNADAPILDDEQIRIFRADDALQTHLAQAFKMMLDFYGFELHIANEDRIQIVPSAEWPERKRNWLTPGNHNLLRITRILTSLCLLGMEEHARAFFAALDRVYESSDSKIIGSRSYDFWRNAIEQR
jgi:hypothetical protein